MDKVFNGSNTTSGDENQLTTFTVYYNLFTNDGTVIILGNKF